MTRLRIGLACLLGGFWMADRASAQTTPTADELAFATEASNARGMGGARGGGGRAGGPSVGAGGARAGGFSSGRAALGSAGGRTVSGSRGGSVSVRGHRTTAVGATTRRGRAVAVRRDFRVYHPGYGRWFGPHWHARYPNAWRAGRWGAATFWTAATWRTLNSWWAWSAATTNPITYEFGTTVVYEGDAVYYEGERVASAEGYYDQAAEIVEMGTASASSNEEWQSLGVFAMALGDETEANTVFQLAVNKGGIIRGNYDHALTETTLPVQGSVDRESQRAAWSVGDNHETIYEAGIFNLTEDEAQLLVHKGKASTQQWMLVRLEHPEEEAVE